jgi:hypothetical protein
MLREWVEEATRTQARLERTLESCPSVAETHPVESLHRLAASARVTARFANPSAKPDLSRLSTPGEGKRIAPDVPAQPAARAESVTRLVEEAHQAVADAKM